MSTLRDYPGVVRNYNTPWVNRPLSPHTWIDSRSGKFLSREKLLPIAEIYDPIDPPSAVYCTACTTVFPYDKDYRRTKEVIFAP